MRLLRRRTRFERAIKAARDAKLPSGAGSLADIRPPKAVKSGVGSLAEIRPPKAVKSGATVVVAATAASAAISALRRRVERSSSDR
jgi:hypothetical protein